MWGARWARNCGADPWSARDALVPLFANGIKLPPRSEGRRGRRPRTRASALPLELEIDEGDRGVHNREDFEAEEHGGEGAGIDGGGGADGAFEPLALLFADGEDERQGSEFEMPGFEQKLSGAAVEHLADDIDALFQIRRTEEDPSDTGEDERHDGAQR